MQIIQKQQYDEGFLKISVTKTHMSVDHYVTDFDQLLSTSTQFEKDLFFCVSVIS